MNGGNKVFVDRGQNQNVLVVRQALLEKLKIVGRAMNEHSDFFEVSDF